MIEKSVFIIVDHYAAKAKYHQDLRFRIDVNKWMSFAVRKGVPLKKGTRVLAIRTNNHSEKGALFLGDIKSGYGKGRLVKFDAGVVDIHVLKPFHIKLEFHGDQVKGIYHMIRLKYKSKSKKDFGQYLLFKG